VKKPGFGRAFCWHRLLLASVADAIASAAAEAGAAKAGATGATGRAPLMGGKWALSHIRARPVFVAAPRAMAILRAAGRLLIAPHKARDI